MQDQKKPPFSTYFTFLLPVSKLLVFKISFWNIDRSKSTNKQLEKLPWTRPIHDHNISWCFIVMEKKKKSQQSNIKISIIDK